MEPDPWLGIGQRRPSRSVHCAMFAVDVVAFGSHRDIDTQRYVRACLYQIVGDACHAAGLPLNSCHHEDRGDGILVVAPAFVSAELLDAVAAHTHAELRRHNKQVATTARIQLRMAVHAGYVRHDQWGVMGRDVVHLFRLLNAAQFKVRFAAGDAEFALISSSYLYKEVIQEGPGLIEPGAYQPLTLINKETHATAWTWLPRSTPSRNEPVPSSAN